MKAKNGIVVEISGRNISAAIFNRKGERRITLHAKSASKPTRREVADLLSRVVVLLSADYEE